ncbi:hypothetical protein [Streptomyces lavendulae]|uniref:hypothetical protein n=1 Tax=Streptomyces lavendulae TaxID=1914 RepID=UPI003801572A
MRFIRTRFASLVAASALTATTALILTAPAHASTTIGTQAPDVCGTVPVGKVCFASGLNYTGTATFKDLPLEEAACYTAPAGGWESAKFGGAEVVLASSEYEATGCNAGAGFSLPQLELVGQPMNDPSFHFLFHPNDLVAYSVSVLVVR